MGFIRDFIQKREDQIIGASDNSLKKIDDFWNEFKEKDIYLIYSDKAKLHQWVEQGSKETTIPWYFFWNLRLKSRLNSNYELLEHFDSLVDEYDPEFVKQKKREYKHLFKRENVVLDDGQQTAIVTDDKHNLVVAGAGSGKTEVLITRIAYLITRKGDPVKPERILALAFQNKARQEIEERLKIRYGLDVEIRTFHSLGNKIIEDVSQMKGVKAPKLKAECCEDWKYQHYIQKLFNKELEENSELKNELVNFMKLFGDDQIERTETDFKTKEDFYKYQRSLRYTALDGTKVKSESERAIINFFMAHDLNGRRITVLYEKPAKWMQYETSEGKENIPKPDFYFQGHDIYLEHWALGKKGKVPKWFAGDNPTEKYKENMRLKKEAYSQNNKTLIETSQADIEDGKLNEVLKKRFLKALKEKEPDKEFELKPVSYEDLVDRVWEDCQEFVKKISQNIANYIVIAKTYRLYPDDIEHRLREKKWSPRQEAFARIANTIYSRYQKDLGKNNNIDFSDMINVAVDYLKDKPEFYKDVYDHILVDEYQDISTQRYELIKELMGKNPKCKLFCVGDDWQSIMGFAGSNLDFFINFSKYFNHPARTDLVKNYRSIKSIVDTGACIIGNNKEGQIKKKTEAHSAEKRPILVYSSLHQKSFYVNYYKQIVEHCLDMIKEYHTKMNYPYSDFMILMRIARKKKLRTFLAEYSQKLGIPITESEDTPNAVRVMSVHKSKGLQSRVVIILNVEDDLYGFPCKLETPDIFLPAIANNDGLREQEERRLFYVAVTRAKEEVIMYTQKCAESQFLTEIKDFTKREELSY